MSHIATVKVDCNDVDAMRAAAEACGAALSLEPGHVRYYGGATRQADHVLTLPGAYDIGFNKRPDGTYEFVGDSECLSTYDNGRNSNVLRMLGPGLDKFMQEYAFARTSAVARAQGLGVSRETTEQGDLLVLLTDYS